MEAGNVYNPKSLDLSYDSNGEDKDIPLSDLVGEEDEHFVNIENKDFIKKNMENLNEVELKIIKARFFDSKTQMQVAKELGISQMTVSRMEKKIINKFKKELKKIEAL